MLISGEWRRSIHYFSSGQANEVTLGKCLFGLLKAEFMYICAPGGKIVSKLVLLSAALNAVQMKH